MPDFSFSPILNFTAFINYLDYVNPSARGVYVWGFKSMQNTNLSNFLPYYVGMARGLTIKDRVMGHYCLRGNYNILCSNFLHEYYRYIKPDSAVRDMTQEQYENYRQYFAYLNQGNEHANGGRPINELNNVRHQIEEHIQFYRNHFHACCIIVDQPSYNLISALERHVNAHIPHQLIGKRIAAHRGFSIDRGNLGNDDFYYNYLVKGC